MDVVEKLVAPDVVHVHRRWSDAQWSDTWRGPGGSVTFTRGSRPWVVVGSFTAPDGERTYLGSFPEGADYPVEWRLVFGTFDRLAAYLPWPSQRDWFTLRNHAVRWGLS